MTQHWWMHFPLCPWGWRQGVAPPKALHVAATWGDNPSFVMFALAVAVAIAITAAISVAIADSVAVAVAIAIAVAIAHWRCHCRQPLPLRSPSLSRHHQPLLLPLPLPLAIPVSITVSHRSYHRCWPSPLPCRWPFPRVVALVQQELYLTNWSKECLPYFILFGQWAAHWSKPDDWPGVKRRWPTPALDSKWRAVSG